MIVLRDEEVLQLLPMGEAIELAREAFLAAGEDEVDMPLRTRIPGLPGGGECLCMPVLRRGAASSLAVKVLAWFPSADRQDGSANAGAVLVLDPSNGRPVGLVEAGALTLIRSGAASGLATSLLARSDAAVLACLGAGALALHQALAVCEVRDIREVRFFDPRTARARRVAAALGGVERLAGVEVRVVASAEDAVVGADVLCTATDAERPVFDARHLAHGVHINGVGACREDAQEVPAAVVGSALVVVDSLAACLREAGDILTPIREGSFDADRVHAEMRDLLTGTRPGRTNDMQTTFFKSVGIAIQDAVVADYLCREATSRNVGQHVVWS